ncbi:MAG: helix-turn-helix domain-containing protein [Bacteroidales bacterium]|nr:helix-turn-helix domain-containing protein [Bacteroidales bacterium]
MELQRVFGKVIKELRLQKKISQEKLAFDSDIDRTYISDIEKGDRNVSLLIIYRIAKALQISLSDLFKKIEDHGEIK